MVFMSLLTELHFPFDASSEVKNLPAKQETWFWSLDQEGFLVKEMATHSSILAWEIPWTEEAIVHGVMKQSDMTEWLNNNFNIEVWCYLVFILKGSKSYAVPLVLDYSVFCLFFKAPWRLIGISENLHSRHTALSPHCIVVIQFPLDFRISHVIHYLLIL